MRAGGWGWRNAGGDGRLGLGVHAYKGEERGRVGMSHEFTDRLSRMSDALVLRDI